ncbi:MAG: hypothetical protein AAB580_04700 [Patescibacteria group bacterium]
MKIEVMEHHVQMLLESLSPGSAMGYLDDLQDALPDKYNFAGEQQKRNMAARMEISRRALERGRAIIITDDEQSFICGECPARIPCFNKPRTK